MTFIINGATKEGSVVVAFCAQAQTATVPLYVYDVDFSFLELVLKQQTVHVIYHFSISIESFLF